MLPVVLLGMGASAGALESPVGCTRAAPPGTSGSTRHHWAGFPLFRKPASRLTVPGGSVEQSRVQSVLSFTAFWEYPVYWVEIVNYQPHLAGAPE